MARQLKKHRFLLNGERESIVLFWANVTIHERRIKSVTHFYLGVQNSLDSVNLNEPNEKEYSMLLPKVYIRLRNRALGTFLTAEDNVEKSKPSRVSVCPSNGKSTQIWTFSQGLLKSKVNKTCMALIGGKSTAGANVALWPEHGRIHQRWRFNKDSTITSYLNASLVLDVKGTARHTLEHLKPAWRFFGATFNEVFEGLS
ncbi:UNVERIFIED_CONTAM: hypothetical protein FKN15_007578 [Acipenser sinensis]